MALSRDDRRHLKRRADEARRLLKEEAAEWERLDGTKNIQRMLDERNPGLYLCKYINEDGEVAVYTTRDDEMILEYYRDLEDPIKAALFRDATKIARDQPVQMETILHDIIERGGG